MHILGIDAERVGEIRAHSKYALRRRMEREAAAVIGCEGDARLDAIDHEAAVREAQPGHMRCTGEGRLDRFGVAIVIIEYDIARHVVIELRRALMRGLLCRNHRGQRLDVDHDGFGRVLRPRQRLGDHASNRIADIAHPVSRQRRATRFFQR